MPLYEYACTACKERIEIIQKISDPPPVRCATCGGEMKKLFSSPAIQFKGSGFYKTDYANSSSTPAGSPKKSDDGSSESSSSSKSDAKSDTKSDTKSESSSKSDSSGTGTKSAE